MATLPNKCVVDTNVPIVANMAGNPDRIPKELFDCVNNCIKAVEHATKICVLVIDAGNEIFEEYRRNLSISGQPGMGDRFMKWVNDNRWKFPEQDRVIITKDGDSYKEFPEHSGLADFDVSDRKFIAVAVSHPQKPAILEATDSKWWGYKDVFTAIELSVLFLCPEYIQTVGVST